MAWVYKMTDERVEEEIKNGGEHDDDDYVEACALSDFLHYELQGLDMPEAFEVKVNQLGTKRELRKV